MRHKARTGFMAHLRRAPLLLALAAIALALLPPDAGPYFRSPLSAAARWSPSCPEPIRSRRDCAIFTCDLDETPIIAAFVHIRAVNAHGVGRWSQARSARTDI